MQAANLARTPYHPHTTLADRQATSSPVPPDTVPPLPRSRRYLWGSRPPPPPALGSRCLLSSGGSGGRLRLGAGPRRGRGRGRGGEAGPARESSAAGSAAGGDSRPGRGQRGAPALSQARPGKL